MSAPEEGGCQFGACEFSSMCRKIICLRFQVLVLLYGQRVLCGRCTVIFTETEGNFERGHVGR